MVEVPLIEVLKQRFGIENVDVFGECVVVPSRFFLPNWEKELKSQGFSVYTNSFNGAAAFFIRLNKTKNNSVSEKPVVSTEKPIVKGKKRFWTKEEEEQLKDMVQRGLRNRDIAKALGRSKIAIQGKVTHMGLVGARLEPATIITAPNPVLHVEDDVVKEYLACVSELYPRYRNVCVLLLKQATSKMEEQK